MLPTSPRYGADLQTRELPKTITPDLHTSGMLGTFSGRSVQHCPALTDIARFSLEKTATQPHASVISAGVEDHRLSAGHANTPALS